MRSIICSGQSRGLAELTSMVQGLRAESRRHFKRLEHRLLRQRLEAAFLPKPLTKKGSSVSSSTSSKAALGPQSQLSEERLTTLNAYYGPAATAGHVLYAQEQSLWNQSKQPHTQPTMTAPCLVTGLQCYPIYLTNGHLFRVEWGLSKFGRDLLVG